MRLLIVGYGYSSRAIHKALLIESPNGLERVIVTCRSAEKAKALRADGLTALIFDGTAPSPSLREALSSATHLVMSAAPSDDGDPFLTHHSFHECPKLVWAGYLSTVGVYGNHDGAWIDESTEPAPQSARSKARVAAEQAWLEAGAARGVPVGLFRLAGIYGPGRSAFDRLRAGTAKRIVKPGQVFNRIHVDDIGRVVAKAALARASGAFNVSDDEPGPPQDVIAYAADLMGVDPPPEVAFETAEMSQMARTFYGENKRVSNARIKQEFGPMLYPTYREGLVALLANGGG